MGRLLLTLGLSSLLIAQLAAGAEAQGKGKGRAKQRSAPMSSGIAQDLGKVSWGMRMADVLELFSKEIEADYRPQIAQVHSALKEDKLRAKMRGEIKKLHDSAVRFDGKKTGWDVSFLKGEFTHDNNESLLVVENDKSKTYYFFIRDHLWKMYKAFDSSVFRGADFAQFAQAVQGRYGEGVQREGEVTPGAGTRQWLEWQDDKTRLRAVDQTGFYGFYCLVFEDKATLRRLPELRRNKGRQGDGSHALVEQVTGSEDDSGSDVHQDVADRITGRLRRKDEPGAGNRSGGSASKGSGSGSAPSSPPPPTVDDEDDPLRGLF